MKKNFDQSKVAMLTVALFLRETNIIFRCSNLATNLW